MNTPLTLVTAEMEIRTQLDVILIISIIWERTLNYSVMPRTIKDVEK